MTKIQVHRPKQLFSLPTIPLQLQELELEEELEEEFPVFRPSLQAQEDELEQFSGLGQLKPLPL